MAYDKLVQKITSQPGPHLARVLIDGANSAALEEVHKTAQAFSEMSSRPSIANTPDWLSLVAGPKNTSAYIALRNQTIRFLTVQNFTASAYERVKISSPSKTIADIGTLPPNSTILVYYNNEDALTGGKIYYRVSGSTASGQGSLPEVPNFVELITKVSSGGLSKWWPSSVSQATVLITFSKYYAGAQTNEIAQRCCSRLRYRIICLSYGSSSHWACRQSARSIRDGGGHPFGEN